MKTTTLTPTLTQLTRLRFVNAFLVREDDGFTLVDTTMGGDRRPSSCSRPHARPARRSAGSRSRTATATTSAGSTR